MLFTYFVRVLTFPKMKEQRKKQFQGGVCERHLFLTKKCGPPKEDKGWGFESFDSYLAQEGKQPLVVCL